MRMGPSLALVLACLIFGAGFAHAQSWQMWVHSNGTITRFNTTEIDSITFVLADTTRPATPMIAASALDGHAVRVTWNAVGDDGLSGTAAAHDLRYATASGLPFESMTPVTLLPPQPAGAAESFDVPLGPGTTYWFVLRVTDEAGNSATSNEATAATPPTGPPHVVIAEVYGGGGQGSGTYDNDYVVLYNPTSVAKSLDNHTLQFAPAGATGWQIVGLSGRTIAPHAYFLIQLGGGSGGIPLPPADHVMPGNVTTAHGKVALMSNNAQISMLCPAPASPQLVDLMSYGVGGCYEGSGPAPQLSSFLAAIRLDQGCRDTDDNATDFIAGPPSPRNSASPTHICP